ncbi:formin-like protein 13 isoform X3 [Prunus yedoensis var. nudiflora]|uniref:Formin-like protein 13 isoform X3 n=1 Tax=Prunus yedoensis var. nudiflora TaxID=2094558 RepID=A0A314UDS6_PRUYE|nr:formin-like protein 13 isoform X3 [Prunus yedoensis var. nudiflora]
MPRPSQSTPMEAFTQVQEIFSHVASPMQSPDTAVSKQDGWNPSIYYYSSRCPWDANLGTISGSVLPDPPSAPPHSQITTSARPPPTPPPPPPTLPLKENLADGSGPPPPPPPPPLTHSGQAGGTTNSSPVHHHHLLLPLHQFLLPPCSTSF